MRCWWSCPTSSATRWSCVPGLRRPDRPRRSWGAGRGDHALPAGYPAVLSGELRKEPVLNHVRTGGEPDVNLSDGAMRTCALCASWSRRSAPTDQHRLSRMAPSHLVRPTPAYPHTCTASPRYSGDELMAPVSNVGARGADGSERDGGHGLGKLCRADGDDGA